MHTSIITTDADLVTSITTFTVAPEGQHDLVNVLSTATEALVQHQPGFISSNIHASTDGTQVVNYTQWATAEAVDVMLARPDIRGQMNKALTIGTPASRRHGVVAVYGRRLPVPEPTTQQAGYQ